MQINRWQLFDNQLTIYFCHVLKAERENNISSYPLLILSGEKDNELALQVAHKWHDKESESKFCIVKNAGHCANMDNPMEFNKIVSDFVTNK